MSSHILFIGLFLGLLVLIFLALQVWHFYSKTALFRGKGKFFFSLICVALAATLWLVFSFGERLYHVADSCFGSSFFGSKQLEYRLDTLANQTGLVPVLVIGSGPAGLSAALYASRARLSTLVLAGPLPGGQLTGTSYVENWPGTGKQLGSALIEGLRKQAEDFGAQIINQSAASIDCLSWPFTVTTHEGVVLHALSLIIASGSVPKRLGVLGEDEYWGKGVTTCAICDAPFYKDKDVIVVGGGDSAIEESLQLAAYAKKVTVLVRKKSMRASASMQEKLQATPTVAVRYSSQLAAIKGNKNQVTGVTVRFTDTGIEEAFAVDGVFLAIGHTPNTQSIVDCVACDSDGYIILQNNSGQSTSQETSVRGVFAAGDVADRVYKQAGVAAGDGIKAALDAEAFLRSIGWTTALGKKLEHAYFDPLSTHLPELQVVQDRKNFDALLKASKLPVVIQFSGDGCPACVKQVPLLQRAAAKLSAQAVFVKVDFSLKGIQKEYAIEQIPLLVVIKNGLVVGRHEGSATYFELMNFLSAQMQEK